MLLSVQGCISAPGNAGAADPPFQPIAAATQPAEMPADGGKRLQVFETAEALQHVFPSMTGETTPDIDFGRNRVVLIDIGTRPSAGHAVQVTDVRIQDGGTIVETLEQRPGVDCMAASVITRPFLFVRIPASGGPVRFRDHVEAVPCS